MAYRGRDHRAPGISSKTDKRQQNLILFYYLRYTDIIYIPNHIVLNELNDECK